MIYPDVSLEVWLNKYPSLKLALPATCICGQPVTPRPYYAAQSLGLTSGPCSCGRERPFSASLLRGSIRDELLEALLSL